LLWVFCFRRRVKWKASSLVPVLICAGVTAAICILEWLGDRHPRLTLLHRLEWITYDWRVREAARHSPSVATNLGFVAMNDESIEALLSGSLPYHVGLLWPRHVYGRLVDELSAQGADVIGFDVLFPDLRPDHPAAQIGGQEIPSDEFLVRSLARNRNVILATEPGLFPPAPFATNALAVSHISAQPEADGILRRTHAFVDVRVWHPRIQEAARAFAWNLDRFTIEPRKLLFPRQDGSDTNVVPLDAEGRFNVGLLERALAGNNARPLVWRFEHPFRMERAWHLGIALAAHELKLDLNQALVDLERGRIFLSNTQGVQRVIPVNRSGQFYINWSIGLKDPRLTSRTIQYLLEQHEARQTGRANEVTNEWKGKLVVVGSIATGNNLSDRGATSLEQHTFLVSNYWNVANSLLTNQFIHPLGLSSRLLLIALLGALSGLCTWKLKTLTAVIFVAAVAAAYVALAMWLFVTSRLWLPLVMPVGGSLLVTHMGLVTYLVRVERRERRRTKDIFSRVVSPDIVRELLRQEKLSLGGARRRVTVFFADVRGFTEVTDTSQKRAEEFVARQRLSGQAAANYFDAEAEAVLNAVNPYLGLVADVIKKHDGTLDKYIGDCVMAFWGAPMPQPRHAACCIRAAMEAQCAIFEMNLQRIAENERRAQENLRRGSFDKELLPMLEILTLGSGINTGVVTAGMVGSEAHLMSYTVFGREVNLASRLESASGRARILISEATYHELLGDEPELAATCIVQEPLSLKGFRDTVKAYEVPWRSPDASPFKSDQTAATLRDQTPRDPCS
jgi:class 3 adenylate cyclase/CHASE2 domain-containing sensor protein